MSSIHQEELVNVGGVEWGRILDRFERMSAEEMVGEVVEKFGRDKVVVTTSGGEKGALLPDLVRRVVGGVPVVFVDTGFYTQPSLELVEYLEAVGHDVRRYVPKPEGLELVMEFPEWYMKPGSEEFDLVVAALKHEPLNRAFDELETEAWFRGVCGFQSSQRAELPVLRRKNGLWQVHPILHWSEGKVKDYMKTWGLPENLDHVDLTKGIGKLECGIGEECGVDRNIWLGL